jgi:hypothetical protein
VDLVPEANELNPTLDDSVMFTNPDSQEYTQDTEVKACTSTISTKASLAQGPYIKNECIRSKSKQRTKGKRHAIAMSAANLATLHVTVALRTK